MASTTAARYTTACAEIGAAPCAAFLEALRRGDHEAGPTRCDLSHRAGDESSTAILTDRGVACIADALSTDVVITELDLSGHALSEVSARHLAHMLERNRAIVKLDLAGNAVQDGGADAIGRALAFSGGVAGRVSYSGSGAPGPSVLTTLSLRGCGVGARGIGLLMDNLSRGGARVQRLILQDNKLGVAAAKHIAAALPSNRYLRSLSLRFNNIGDEGLALLAAALVRSGSTAGGNDAVKSKSNNDDPASLPGLTALDLSGNGITDQGVRSLTQQVSSGMRLSLPLVRLGLRSNHISDDGCASLAGALVARGGLLRNVRQLYLGANPHITGDGCEALFHTLCVTVDLVRLDLQGCPLHLSAVKALEGAMRESPPLTQLVCDGPLTDAVAAALPSLAEAVRSNTTICELELGAVDSSGGQAPALTHASRTSAETGLRAIASTLSLNRRVLAAEQQMASNSSKDPRGAALGDTPLQLNNRGLDDWASASMALMASPTAVGGSLSSSLREASLPSVTHDGAAAGLNSSRAASPPPPLPSIPPPPNSALFDQAPESPPALDAKTHGDGILSTLDKAPTSMQEDEAARLQDTRSDIVMLRHELHLLRNSPANAVYSPSRVAPPVSTPPPSGVLAIQGLYGDGDSNRRTSSGSTKTKAPLSTSADSAVGLDSSLVPGDLRQQSSPPLPPPTPPSGSPSVGKVPSPDDLETLFNHVDKNNDGAINVREMILGLRREPELANLLNLPSHIHQEDGTRVAFERIFQEMDRDEHREITLAQFREYVHNHISREERKRRNAKRDADTHALAGERREMVQKSSRHIPNVVPTVKRVEDGYASFSSRMSLPDGSTTDLSSSAADGAEQQQIHQLLSAAQIRAQMSPEDRTAANQVEIASLRSQLSDLSDSFHRLRESKESDVPHMDTRHLPIPTRVPVLAAAKETAHGSNHVDRRTTAAESSALEVRLLAVEEAVQRNHADLLASQRRAKNGNTNAKDGIYDNVANDTKTQATGEQAGRLTISSLSVPGDEAKGGSSRSGGRSVISVDKLYARIQMLEEGMRVATVERNMAVTMLKELAGRVSGAVNLVNETITSKMETVRYGEEFEARLQALEVQIEVQREGHVESAMRVEDTIVAMSNRLQILEEAIIKEQESTLQQLEQLIKISPATHHPQRGGKVRNAKRSRG